MRATLQPTLQALRDELASAGDAQRAKNLTWFFKTGKGEYGEGDQFLGIQVPIQRKIAHRYLSLSLADIARLLQSPIHEHRFTAAEILVAKYERASTDEAEKIFGFYLRHVKRLNNWDLVDTSAPYIVGVHLRQRSRDILYQLARSTNLWERRVAMVATLGLIKCGEIEDTFRIARMLLTDEHDLIRKATGWALREAGRVSRTQLLNFLREHYCAVSRTTLRYAIEHLPQEQRKLVLAGKFSR